MVSKLQTYGTNQRLPGVASVSVEQAVTVASPLIAHTCPTGKRQRCFAIFIATVWGGSGRNLRCRIRGVQLLQMDDVNHPVTSVQAQLITPEFLLDSGETVSVTTQNTGTQGGTMRCSVIINGTVPVEP